MGSSSKRRTTFQKLNREQKLREKRFEKQQRKEARKLEASLQQAAPAGDELDAVDAPDAPDTDDAV